VTQIKEAIIETKLKTTKQMKTTRIIGLLCSQDYNALYERMQYKTMNRNSLRIQMQIA
jgi:hypothetical protein